jgi:asparagine synthase (glutamine-hydrolysing)
MCGLTGFLGDARPRAERERSLVTMLDTIAHRGPDDHGTWIDPSLALGHRRLAIIDISPGGRQPMVSASERFVLAFNGEIYNHNQLRRELAQRGHTFRGDSDTEVLLALAERHGIEKAVSGCIGMFALALWDRQERVLTLCRDRFGEKPLYYGWCGDVFMFASELKALRRHPEFGAKLNLGAAESMLRYGHVVGEQSIFEDFYRLPPAHILTLRVERPDGTSGRTARPCAELRRYWSPPVAASSGEGAEQGFEGASRRLEALVTDAVQLQMKADVPLGAFLSGGIDSSLVTALMQEQSAAKIQTFAIGFDEAAFDESQHARRVAEFLGTDHHELIVTDRDALALVPQLPGMFDEPFADSSQIPTHLVARFARTKVTVALSGDGGDEIFGGYAKYRLGQRLRRVPLGGVISRALDFIPWPLAEMAGRPLTAARRRVDTLRHVLGTDDAGLVDQLSMVNRAPGLLLRDYRAQRQVTTAQHPKGDYLRLAMAYDLASYLPDDVLVKVDRASMAVSLESRAPLLDHRIAEFAATLPSAFLQRGPVGKLILRDVLYRHVPRAIVDRPKQGFSVPLARWLRAELRDWAATILDPNSNKATVLDLAACRRMLKQHLDREADFSPQLWSALMLQCWIDNVKAHP